jgi:hypothetical protein
MRPNDSALSPATFCKSPFGAFFAHSLVLGMFISSGAAQTRLDSTQVAPLQGAAQGPFASTKLRDVNSAVDHGNGSTNGIASAIAGCGAAISCSILVPPSYSTAEAVPGYQLNYNTPAPAATTPGNILIVDRRYGDARMSVNNNGFSVGFINAPSAWLYSYYSKAPQNAYFADLYLRQWSLDGGHNQQAAALGYADKTTWATMLSSEISHTPGQHENLAFGSQQSSLGSWVGIRNLVQCYGGYNSEGDLGCHAIDNKVLQGPVEYSGTLIGSASTGATALSIVPSQGASTQGAGRFLARTSAGTISAGTISQIAANNNSANLTGSGTSWPVSSVIAQLGTNVNGPGSFTVTPSSFTTGSASLIQTSSLVCVADQESFEMVYPTAVTATSFTADFAKPHPGTAVLSVAGLCGYLLDLTADDVTNATYPIKSQTITGTLHFAFPVMFSSSPTAVSLWVTGGGGWQQLTTRWSAASANGYMLSPFAEVLSTQQGGGLSNTLTVGPNNVAWTAGDTVSEFLYPSTHYNMGNAVIESYYPNITPTNVFSFVYNMPLQSGEAMMTFANNTPTSFYGSHGGVFNSPTGIYVIGPKSQGLTVDLPSDNATIGVGCASPCNSTQILMAAANGSYYDFFSYDQGNRRWVISAAVNAAHYYLASNQFITPFSNVSMAKDNNSQGYIATRQLRSSVSANSDSSGELVFTNTSSITQTLQGTYASHPECLARPQFDAGASNRYWISYSAASFTVNFAAPVNGVVTYSCAARN